MDDEAEAPFIDPDSDYPCCWFCPALRFPRTGFLVADRPSRDWPFDAADGYRYTVDTRTPVCVHPGRVGLEPERRARIYAEPPLPDPGQAGPGRAGPGQSARRRRWWRLRPGPRSAPGQG
ncbi:hypothetical protein P8A18_32825 [Streptomyces castrisilvae]|uniref:Uncharacterized protein n=1 Tax=Streptomyces castrisilvae TaxID=3033811 RepID=A0ABY9HTT9_9ACTN|nr:hypothetical protein [Streptomyces sp. Mut1]WLQ37935.1 hypothetical protein P8A18_32825 [Streptomyces sp. Mut1]